jgi:MraZ protein
MPVWGEVVESGCCGQWLAAGVGDRPMFYGESFHSLDAKGRVFVPKRFQDLLTRTSDGSLSAFLALGEDACLYLFSEAGFKLANEELRTRVFTSEEQRAAKRMFFANSQRVDLDSAGRILIPEKLRHKVGMEKDVVMVGNDDRAEIWPRGGWEDYQERNEGVLKKLSRVMGSKPAEA